MNCDDDLLTCTRKKRQGLRSKRATRCHLGGIESYPSCANEVQRGNVEISALRKLRPRLHTHAMRITKSSMFFQWTSCTPAWLLASSGIHVIEWIILSIIILERRISIARVRTNRLCQRERTFPSLFSSLRPGIQFSFLWACYSEGPIELCLPMKHRLLMPYFTPSTWDSEVTKHSSCWRSLIR